MKKKLISALMCTVLAASMLAGCGSGETNPPADASDAATDDAAADDDAQADDTEDAAEDETETAEEEVVTNTFGDPI